MNCKQGDLAVIVYSPSNPLNIGRFVRCIQLVPERGSVDGRHWYVPVGTVTWLVETDGSPITWGPHGYVQRRAYADHCLRPIRDNDGEDQTLTWAPKHEGVTA